MECKMLVFFYKLAQKFLRVLIRSWKFESFYVEPVKKKNLPARKIFHKDENYSLADEWLVTLPKNGADNRIFQRDPSCAQAEWCDYRLSPNGVAFRSAPLPRLMLNNIHRGLSALGKSNRCWYLTVCEWLIDAVSAYLRFCLTSQCHCSPTN